MDDSISFDEALEELRKLLDSAESVTQEAIEEIVSKVSVADDNATTVLYTITNKLDYYVNSDGMRHISHTEAYKFLGNDKYTSAIYDLIEKANPSADKTSIYKMVDDYLNGVEKFENFKPTGVQSKGTTGPWADISYRFATATKGDVFLKTISKKALQTNRICNAFFDV